MAWTYLELRRQARRVARGLLAAGVDKGERVGLLMGNRGEFVAALFGCALAGTVPVTLSTFSSAHELRVLIEQSDIVLRPDLQT